MLSFTTWATPFFSTVCELKVSKASPLTLTA